MEASKQRKSIAPTMQNVDSQDDVRTDYANNQPVALLLSQEEETGIAGNGRAYMQASAFRLPVFYDGHPPHECINHGRAYINEEDCQQAGQAAGRNPLPTI